MYMYLSYLDFLLLIVFLVLPVGFCVVHVDVVIDKYVYSALCLYDYYFTLHYFKRKQMSVTCYTYVRLFTAQSTSM